ncbi:MAG: CNNM domain-containing protein, partial [Ginsengibacter sp.]
MDWISIIAIVASLILIGFFAGIEIAFVSVSKLSIELRKKQGSYPGRTWAAFMEKPTRFIGTTLIAFNILMVIYGLLWSNILNSVWKYWGIDNPF